MRHRHVAVCDDLGGGEADRLRRSDSVYDIGDRMVLLGAMCNGARQGRIRTKALVITSDGVERAYDCKLADFVRHVWPDEENAERRVKDLRFLGDLSKRDFLVQECARWILVRADFCRALIEEDMVVFLSPGGDTFERFKEEFLQEITQRSQDRDFHNWATECIICANVIIHTLRFQVLKSVINRFLDQVNRRVSDSAVMRLFPLKITLSRFIEQVKPLVYCLQELVQTLESRSEAQFGGQRKLSTPGNRSVKSSFVAEREAQYDEVQRNSSEPMVHGAINAFEGATTQPLSKGQTESTDALPLPSPSLRSAEGSRSGRMGSLRSDHGSKINFSALNPSSSSSSSSSSDVAAGFEDMLRTWKNNANEVLADAEEVSEHMTEALRFTEASGDYLRNRLLRLELFATVVSIAMAFGALVSGIFGMNLTSGLESLPNLFNLAVAGIVFVGFTIICTSIRWYGKTKKAYRAQCARFGNNLFFHSIADDSYVLSLCTSSGDGALDHDAHARILQDIETLPSISAAMESAHSPAGGAVMAGLNISQQHISQQRHHADTIDTCCSDRGPSDALHGDVARRAPLLEQRRSLSPRFPQIQCSANSPRM